MSTLHTHDPGAVAAARSGQHDLPDRSFAAVVVDWDALAPHDAGLALVVEDLCRHGLHLALHTRGSLDELDVRLGARPHGPGRLWIAAGDPATLVRMHRSGPSPTPGHGPRLAEEDVVPALLGEFAALGVGPGLVLLVGGEERPDLGATHLGADTDLTALLTDQGRRRRHLRVPDIDPDPRWVISREGPDRLRHRVEETIFSLTAGGVGTRGALEEPCEYGAPMVLAAGVYAGERIDDGLLPGPLWHELTGLESPARHRRTLDLRTGLLVREELHADPAAVPLRSARFASIATPGITAMRIETASPLPDQADDDWALSDDPAPGAIGALRVDRRHAADGRHAFERLAALVADTARTPTRRTGRQALGPAVDQGFDALLSEHRRAWADRWDAACISIPGDPESELGLRFALFQLWSLCAGDGELAVGARGLTGPGYSGHVFWDADVHVLPAMMTIHPATARAMVAYRLRRLGAARAHAAAVGCAGARYPWESARTGVDVTPRMADVGTEEIPILTGQLEEHINADVAWAVCRRAAWTGERLTRRERELLAETARYWACRIRTDGAGAAHIDDVIGPDEYHEMVDDNAFTNVMVRWHLRTAADAAPDLVSATERRRWRELAAALVDGYDATTGRYEQFTGYFDLEPLLVRDLGTPPFAADVLLGRERVSGSQVIKQPDVLMLHQLVPDEVAPGSLETNLEFYGPRTAHGSSLAPASTALLLARAGRPDEAMELLTAALGVDLHDRSGLAAVGIHLAAAAGAWQAVLFGFLGLDVRDGVVHLDPHLPATWGEMEVRFGCLGAHVRLRVLDSRGRLVARLSATRRLRVRGPDGRVVDVPGNRAETEIEIGGEPDG